ncbi:rhodanese-like domain-containing protein [Glaciimonas soli]|uniref:Rhodanese-like domain-containing protein n=1 Tax=Glaciimonas soli TaxID=2590999 RepID=A0A843YS17_9BURK|nr:rhodanese-like domain-containing protein [Glaciimonas soli]MQR00298.1 rhodanese-like domain-containing protein [Glaciimonas soli]
MKFLIDNIFLLGLVVLSGGALLFPMLRGRGNKVTTLQATQLINQGKSLVLDVRDADSFAAAHLLDAKNIPLKDLAQRLVEIDKFKAKNVIVVCQTGVQSAKATSQLSAAGFEQVYNLEGGMAAWQTQGLPTISKESKVENKTGNKVKA